MKIPGRRLSNFMRKGHAKEKRNSESAVSLQKAGMPLTASVVANEGVESSSQSPSSSSKLPATNSQDKPLTDLPGPSDSHQLLKQRRATTIGAPSVRTKSNLRRASSPAEHKQLTIAASDRRHSLSPVPQSPSSSHNFAFLESTTASERADWHQYYSSRYRRHSTTAIMR